MDIKKVITLIIADIIGYSSVAATAVSEITFLGELTDGNISLQDAYVSVGLVWLFFRVINDAKLAFKKEGADSSQKDDQKKKITEEDKTDKKDQNLQNKSNGQNRIT
ncbi:hypothetical protein [Flammeovirga sp. SJP92]|uniref:hypothetical protein n=1 Tax=Flammeovirga sp. SJP92 TaxID=1775430 RepID=UPI000788FD86|nr:hypothetical protein [Flammeovirga sp. SJP92]KXX71363.1 hypothetical protein AVL50_32460 [Flammeovirga sp. SJP92]